MESAFALEDLNFFDDACQKAVRRAIADLKEAPGSIKRHPNGVKTKLDDGTVPGSG